MSTPQIHAPDPQSSTSPPYPLSKSKTTALGEEALLDIPSHLDLALNVGPNQTILPPKSTKISETSLLDPEAFRRLSISTISSCGSQIRVVYPYPVPSKYQRFKTSCRSFWQRNFGLFLVALSQLFGALMNVATRLLELEGVGMDPLQVLFARQVLTMIFCCIWMWWKKIPDFPFGTKGIQALLLCRGLTGFFGIYGIYYSILYLPVADAIVITFLSPTVAAYACYLFLREPFPRSAQYASLFSLLGVVLIARPTSFFSSDGDAASIPPSPNNTTVSMGYGSDFPTPTSGQRLSAVAVAMVGVVAGAGAITTIRWIGHRAHPLISINYFAVCCILISTIGLVTPIPGTPSFKLPASLRQWCLLVFIGFCGFVMQFLLTKGLATGGRGEGGRATNMMYTNMLFALALDRLVFGLTPGWWSLGGSGLILGSAIFIAMQKAEETSEGAISEWEEEEAVGVGLERGSGTEEEGMAFLSEAGSEETIRGVARN